LKFGEMVPRLRLFDTAISGFKRRLARGTLGFLFRAQFMRRRGLAILSRYYTKGQLVLRYRMADHTLYLDPTDDVITARVLLRGSWQRRDLERVVEMLRTRVPSTEGRLFIDVGANIGSETIYAILSGFFSGAMAIEAEAGNFSLLQENLAANGLTTMVRAVNCAAGERAGSGVLDRSTWNKGGHALVEDRDASKTGDTIVVEILPLQAILVNAGYGAKDAGLVWIDVNGTEASVLRGMKDILEARVPVVVEHLPSLISVETAHEIHNVLAKYYTSFWRIDGTKGGPAPVSAMDPLCDAGDFLFF
jgi:FkbM family methyltransferase